MKEETVLLTDLESAAFALPLPTGPAASCAKWKRGSLVQKQRVSRQQSILPRGQVQGPSDGGTLCSSIGCMATKPVRLLVPVLFIPWIRFLLSLSYANLVHIVPQIHKTMGCVHSGRQKS